LNPAALSAGQKLAVERLYSALKTALCLVGREKRARAVLVALLGEHGVGQRLHVGRIGVTGVVGFLMNHPSPIECM